MTPGAQCILIAKACGKDLKICPIHHSVTCCGRGALPDYLNDLNAIQAAVLSQPHPFQDWFQSALNAQSFENGKLFCERSAKDWADAFIACLASKVP
jgi:hypothetical protein